MTPIVLALTFSAFACAVLTATAYEPMGSLPPPPPAHYWAVAAPLLLAYAPAPPAHVATSRFLAAYYVCEAVVVVHGDGAIVVCYAAHACAVAVAATAHPYIAEIVLPSLLLLDAPLSLLSLSMRDDGWHHRLIMTFHFVAFGWIWALHPSETHVRAAAATFLVVIAALAAASVPDPLRCASAARH